MMGWKYWFFLMLKCLIPTCTPTSNPMRARQCLVKRLYEPHALCLEHTDLLSACLPQYTHLSKVSRMVLVHHDSVVVLTTSISASSWMLPVLADTAMSSADVTTLLPVLPETCVTR